MPDPSQNPFNKLPSAEDLLAKFNQGQIRTDSPVSYEDPNEFRFQLKAGQDNQLLRAQNQGWGETLGIRLANMPVNIVAGIGEMVGYAGALMTERGEARDYSNALTELMQSVKNPFGEVYRENPNEAIDLTDSAWWIDNLGGLGESVATFAVPGAALGTGFRALAQAAAVGRKSLSAFKAAGQVATAGTMAYMEGAISGNEVYKRTYDNQYLRNLAMGDDADTAHTKAVRTAAEAASTTVQANVVMNTLLNMTALAPLFRGSQNRVMDFMRDNAARVGKETAGEMKDRLVKLAAERGILKNRSGITSYLSESFQEGLEEVNTQYAESLGERINQGEKIDLVSALGDFGTALKTVSNDEGILNFALGAVGGVGQTVVLDNLPVHRTQVQGADGKMERKLVSSRTLNADGTRKYFDSITDALAADVEWHDKKMKELKQAVDSKDNIAAETVRQEMFDVLALNAVQMGLGDQWINTFEEIASTDNTPNTEALHQQLQDINAQIQQTQDPQVQTQLQQAKQDIVLQLAKPQSEAMQRGLAADLNDNSYKDRAKDAIRDLKKYKSIYDELVGTYNSEEEVALGVPDYLFIQASNLYRQERLLESAVEDERKLSAEHELQHAGVKSTAQMFDKEAAKFNDIQETYQKVVQRIVGDASELDNALQSGDSATLEKMMSKYKVIGFVGSDMVAEIRRRMKKQIEAANKAVKGAKESLEAATGFKDWQAANPGKALEDYAKVLSRDFGAKRELKNLREHIAIMEETVRENRGKVNELLGDSGNMRKTIDKLKPILKKRAQEQTKRIIDQEIASQQQKNMAEAHVALNTQALQDQERALSLRLRDINTQIVTVNDDIARLKDRIAKLNITSHSVWNVPWKIKMTVAKSDLEKQEKFKNDLIAQRDKLVTELETVRSGNPVSVPPPAPPPGPNPPPPPPGPTPVPPPPEPAPVTTITDPQVKAAAKYDALLKRISSAAVLGALTEAENTMKGGMPVTLEQFLGRPDVAAALAEGTVFRRAVTSAFAALEEYIATLGTLTQPEPETETSTEDAPEEEAPGPEGPAGGGRSPVTVDGGQPTTEGGADVVVGDGPIHNEKKTTNILKVNTNTLLTTDWKDRSNDWRISGKELNPNMHPSILAPTELQKDTELFLSVDYDYNGPLKVYGTSEYEVGTIAKFQDAQGKIRDWENVPVKMTTRDGRIIGYLPTMNWLQEQYEGVDEANPEYKRNIVTGWWMDEAQTNWFDNLGEQANVLRKVRELVRDAGTVRGVIDEKGTGTVILNKERDPRDERLFITVPGPALSTDPGASLLPGELTLGVVSPTGDIYVGKGTPVDVANADIVGNYANMPVALLPMANGKLVAAPLYMQKLDDEPSLRTIEHAIVVHLTRNQAEIDKFMALSGYNLADAAELRRFINTQFTYTQSFDASNTALDPQAKSRFLFNILTPKSGGPTRIMVGVEGSGSMPLIAKVTAGKLDPVFSDMLRSGLSEQRYKNVNFSQNNVRGINSSGEFKEYYFNETGWQAITYKSYNDYVKTYATTTVYGRNKLNGEYVYSANPRITLNPDSLVGVRGPNTSPTLVQEENPAPADVLGEGPETDEVTLSSEDLEGFDGIAYALPPEMIPSTPSFIGPSNSMQPVTMDYLQNLYNFTPPGDRNDVTVEQAFQNLLALRTSFVAEGYNPFLKCK